MHFIHGTQGYKYPRAIFVHRKKTQTENKTAEKHNHKKQD
jgi:hypothetical protein